MGIEDVYVYVGKMELVMFKIWTYQIYEVCTQLRNSLVLVLLLVCLRNSNLFRGSVFLYIFVLTNLIFVVEQRASV